MLPLPSVTTLSSNLTINAGDSFDAGLFGFGYVTQSATRLTIAFALPKQIKYGVNITLQTGSRFEVRGITGYVAPFSNGNTVEVVGNSDYTITIQRIGDGAQIYIDITLTNGTFNITNNTPIIVRASALKLAFS